MVRRILFIICLLGGCLTAAAQQSLNLYTTTSGVVTFTFEQTPKVTFPETDIIRVATDDVTVEFPFAEVEKITFEDGVTAVESIRMSNEKAQILIYDIAGRLVRRSTSQKGSATADISTLPAGTYVVRDGTRSYKITKR